MEFRVPPELRGYCDANTTNTSKPSWDDICAFKVFPFKCQTFLQLFELDDEYIQREIRKPPKQTTCNYKTGWFSEALLDNLRLRVAVRFVSVFPEPGFEDVLKSIQEEFVRSEKRMQKDALKPCQPDHQETAKDMKKYKSKNKEKDGDVNEDEDSEDMDDEYEELNAADDDEDDEISLSSHGYGDKENNSRTYLQGLFDRFPSSEPALDGAGDGSDGEYQIYEQESNTLDDSDDDDDDDDDE